MRSRQRSSICLLGLCGVLLFDAPILWGAQLYRAVDLNVSDAVKAVGP